MKRKLLITYRLFDPTYGPEGNKCSLFVSLLEDNTLSYTFISGWQDSGMGQATSNFGLKRSLPMGVRNFKNVEALDEELKSILATGYGSSRIKTHEILNDL